MIFILDQPFIRGPVCFGRFGHFWPHVACCEARWPPKHTDPLSCTAKRAFGPLYSSGLTTRPCRARKHSPADEPCSSPAECQTAILQKPRHAGPTSSPAPLLCRAHRYGCLYPSPELWLSSAVRIAPGADLTLSAYWSGHALPSHSFIISMLSITWIHASITSYELWRVHGPAFSLGGLPMSSLGPLSDHPATIMLSHVFV